MAKDKKVATAKKPQNDNMAAAKAKANVAKEKAMKGYEIFSDKLVYFGGKFGNQRHMASIRDGFATFMPLIIVGALATLVNNVFIQPNSLLAD
jgi:hypothetical protein